MKMPRTLDVSMFGVKDFDNDIFIRSVTIHPRGPLARS
jgi:hypothetical protein